MRITEGTHLGTIAQHIEIALRNLAPTEIGFAQERLRRQEAQLATSHEQYRLGEESLAALDSEIAVAQGEVDQKTQLVKDAEALSKSKKPSLDRDAINAAWQTRADAADHVESLKRRKTAAAAEIERYQRPEIIDR
jgi:hypothetical protein